MALRAKACILVEYVGWPNEWHGRVVLAHVVDCTWVTLTPDADVYAENLALNIYFLPTVIPKNSSWGLQPTRISAASRTQRTP